MLITNATSKKLRFSIMKDKSEDEMFEAFAYMIAPHCSLNLEGIENYVVSEENDTC